MAPVVDDDDDDDKKASAVLLIHGFGCSSTYWRKLIASLMKNGYKVHALDLLGQGKSSKPGRAEGIEYSINLWAELVDSYISENMTEHPGIILGGNSLGSLVALAATTRDFSTDTIINEKIKGLCMFNCGVGLNFRGIAEEDQWNPFQKFVINVLYIILDRLIFRNQLLLTYVLDNVVTKDLLRDTLQSLYKHSPESVDQELVDSFYFPAKDKGSPEALSQIYSNDPGRTPMELIAKYDVNHIPIHLIWGDTDVVTPVEGGTGQFFRTLANDPESNVTFDLISPSGHIPFDDNPKASNGAMLRWLENIE